MSAETVPALWNKAETYARQGQWAAALAQYDKLLARDPAHAMAMLRASRMALSLGRYRDGHAYAMRALARRPGSDDAVLTLARALRMYNEPVALLECVEHSRWRERRSATWLTDLAMMVSTIGANDLAMEMLDLAVIREPQSPQARYFRGVVQMFFGNMEAAERELELCISKAPAFTQAHWVLSRLRKQTDEVNHVERMRALVPRIQRGSESDAYLAFALHNELHDLGRYADSWQALQQGCRCKRQLTPHDRADARRMYEGLMSLCDERFVQPESQPEAPFVPVFIVGMHRSGSTLLEQLLGGHPQVADGGETYSFTTQMRFATDYRNKGVVDSELVRRSADADFALVGRRFYETTEWRTRGKPYLTEKLPSNFLNLGFIAKALPQARILHMVRDPLDTCFSNLRTMFSDVNTFSYDQQELVEWYGQYRQLMDHWHRVIPGRILDVHYDALVADPEGVMRGVLDFCGLPWDTAATTLEGAGAVATASSPQMRGGIMKNRKAAWMPYEGQLQPLIEGLAAYR